MKSIAIFILLIFGAQCASAQYCGQRQDNVTNALGQAIPNVKVTYYTQSTGALATVYADATCATTPAAATANPQTTNGLGLAVAYLAPGLYTVTYSGPQIQTQTYLSQNIPNKGGTTPVTGIPGPVYNIADYGAISGCAGGSFATNKSAIQAAFDGALATGGSVYFPTDIAASGTTVYCTNTVNPKGVSFFGPPGASGPFASYLNQSAVAIQGAPGQDVFNVPDPTSGGYVAPRISYTVQDLAIFNDVSVDSSASHPNRKPGRTCKDVVTHGTAVIDSAAQCVFQPGDVGQAIKVGSTTTTVLSYQSATEVTLNTTVGAATGVTAYISAMGLSATATIGNCGFCYDDSTGIGTAISKSVFRDVIIRDVNGTDYTNNTVGFFFQGNDAPTHTVWQNVSVAGLTHGFSYVPVSAATPTTGIYAGMADFNLWDQVNIDAVYPFLAYSGHHQEIKGMQLYSGAGFQCINAYGTGSNCSNWKIDIPEQEAQSCPSGQSWRIAGINHEISRLSIGMCNGSTIQWDASDSTVRSIGTGAFTANFNVTGNLNHFNYPDGADLLTAYLTLNPTGIGAGNTFTSGTNFNPFGGQQPARAQYANPGLSGLSSSPFGSPGLSRGGIYLNRTSDFVNKGASTYYFNNEDLWLWPQEVQDSAGGGTTDPILTADATSETGSSFQVNTSGRTNQYVSASNGVSLYIGSQVPAGKVRVYFKAKAASATNMTVSAAAGGTGIGSTTASVTTSWAVYSFDADATTYTGQMFILNFASVTANAKVAWISVRPWDSDTVTSSITLGSGVPMTSKQGTGAKVQASTGSATASGNIFKADANGNTTDGGVAASAIVTAGSPTVGQAACIQSLGPPIVIGKCTSVVGAGGACTCAP